VTIYGVDTSHWKWSAGVDFARMKASGRCDYLIAKASEGYYTFADPSYGGWRSGAKNAGMLFGSFHFARPGDPVAQADYYLSVAKPVDGDLVCLDLEDTTIPNAGDFGAAFCQRVHANTGTWPLLYTYPDYLATRDLSPIQRLGCPLWFADYSDPLNSIAPWSAYAIRQFTDKGSVPGQPGTLDCNSSPLTLDQLRAYAIGATPPQEDPLTDPTVLATINKIAANSQSTNDAVNALNTVIRNPKTGMADRLTNVQNAVVTLLDAVHALASGQPTDTAALKAAADKSSQALAELAQAAGQS
jgi:lysozyme